MTVIDITAPAGSEAQEVSDAKDLVYDYLYCLQENILESNNPEDVDLIHPADRIVGDLIASGWRPTTVGEK